MIDHPLNECDDHAHRCIAFAACRNKRYDGKKREGVMASMIGQDAERRRAWSVIAMAIVSATLWAAIIEGARILW